MVYKIPSGAKILRKVKETLRRFPLSMASSLVVAWVALYFIESAIPPSDPFYGILFRISFVASLMVLVFAVSRLLTEGYARSRYLLFLFLSLVGAFLYYTILPDDHRDFHAHILMFRHAFLMILFGVALLWSPFLFREKENCDYWEYARGILFSLFMTFVFTVILVLGVNGALFAIEKLFDAGIASKRYIEADILIVALFSVGYFFSQIPLNPAEINATDTPPKVEKFFTRWVLTPLSLIYFVILYSYSARLLVLQQWPKGILAWLIVVFSAVAILTFLFWTGVARSEKSSWRRWIWLAVLVQTVMLFVAIGMRITQYSWTESRYMVFVFGVWLALISLYFLLVKSARIKWIFISVSFLIALTQFGPLGAYRVSENAQVERLVSMLESLQKYNPPQVLAPIKLRYEISDVIDYLNKRYGELALRPIFPEIIAKYERENSDTADEKVHPNMYWELPGFITEELGFEYINRWEYTEQKKNKSKSVSLQARSVAENFALVDIGGDDYLTNINSYFFYECTEESKEKVVLKGWDYDEINGTLTYGRDHLLTLSVGVKTIRFNLDQLVDDLIGRHGRNASDIDPDEMTQTVVNGTLAARLVLKNIDRKECSGREQLSFEGTLYIGGLDTLKRAEP